jgi:hypothetical protein
MKDFWITCGHHLLDRNASGGLVVTDEFLKAYFARPELMPPDDACAVERRLHRELLADPRRAVAAEEVAAIADADAQENWQFVLAFRELLLREPTLEAAYLALVRSGSVNLPPLLVNHLVHVILRNALDGCEDPFVLRAAELFFRPQRIVPHEHSLLLGDEEVIGGPSPTPVLSLMSMLGAVTGAEVEVLSEGNADSYWQRSDQFDLALDFTGRTRGRAALADAMKLWISHLLGVMSQSSRSPPCAMRSSPGMLGSMLKPPGWATGFGMERRWMTAPQAVCWRCSGSLFQIPAWSLMPSGASRSI